MRAIDLRSNSALLEEERPRATEGPDLGAIPGLGGHDRDDEPPAWAAAELPPEHGEIVRKIENLRQEARKYEKFAEVLWRTGTPLTLGVRDIFEALGFRTELAGEAACCDLVVELEPQRRLLVEVLGGVAPFDKKSPEIARALRAIQEEAGPGDRVAFAANMYCDKPVAMREQPPATPDALRIINGLGINLVTTSTLFGLWRYSRQDMAGARKSILLLHGLDGGIFR